MDALASAGPPKLPKLSDEQFTELDRAAGMREYAAAHDWLTIIQLPTYAPHLNPVGGVWSLLRRGPLANTAFTDDEHLERTLRRGLRHIQLHPDLIDGCLAGTRLPLTQQPTTTRGSQ